jgi:hypothetical protein
MLFVPHREDGDKNKNKFVSFIDDRGLLPMPPFFLVFCIQNKQNKQKKKAACPAQLHPDVHYVIRESRAAAAPHHVNVPFEGPVATAINTTSDIVGNQTRDSKKDEGEKNPSVKMKGKISE